MWHTPNVLFLTRDDEERRKLQEILANHALLCCTTDLTELAFSLKKGGWDLLLCDWPYYCQEWSHIQKLTGQFCPDLPAIVLSRTGGEREWADALGSGAFDLLAWPSPKPAILAAVERASASLEACRMQSTAPKAAVARYVG